MALKLGTDARSQRLLGHLVLMFAGVWVICKIVKLADDGEKAKTKENVMEMEEVKELPVGMAVIAKDMEDGSKEWSSGLQDDTTHSVGRTTWFLEEL